ncbi:HAT C-terminal dimerization domain [Trinorchestia longiramus]|nr:HAT C-terminal dimerization domain [Trinorchestia longiramus]
MVDKYQRMKRIQMSDEPLLWWRTNAQSSSYLATLVNTYLACPSSSAESERLLNGVGIIYDEKRSRLVSPVMAGEREYRCSHEQPKGAGSFIATIFLQLNVENLFLQVACHFAASCTVNCFKFGLSIGDRPPFLLGHHNKSHENTLPGLHYQNPHQPSKPHPQLQQPSFYPNFHPEIPFYATHDPHPSHGSSSVNPCMSHHFQILTNFYGDYFKKGVICSSGGNQIFDVRDEVKQGHNFALRNDVLKSFTEAETSEAFDTRDGGGLCEKVPKVCELFNQKKQRSSRLLPLTSEGMWSSMRDNINNIFSFMTRRSFPSSPFSSSSTFSTTSSSKTKFPLFSVLSFPTFHASRPSPDDLFQPAQHQQQGTSLLLNNSQDAESCHGDGQQCPANCPIRWGDNAQRHTLSTKNFQSQHSPPRTSKVNISTKNSHHLNNSTHSRQQITRNQPSCLRTGWNSNTINTNKKCPVGATHSTHFSGYPASDGYLHPTKGVSVCEESDGVAYPLVGVSVITGRPLRLLQHHPLITQPVFFTRCVTPHTQLLSGRCEQKFLPVAFLVDQPNNENIRYSRYHPQFSSSEFNKTNTVVGVKNYDDDRYNSSKSSNSLREVKENQGQGNGNSNAMRAAMTSNQGNRSVGTMLKQSDVNSEINSRTAGELQMSDDPGNRKLGPVYEPHKGKLEVAQKSQINKANDVLTKSLLAIHGSASEYQNRKLEELLESRRDNGGGKILKPAQKQPRNKRSVLKKITSTGRRSTENEPSERSSFPFLDNVFSDSQRKPVYTPIPPSAHRASLLDLQRYNLDYILVESGCKVIIDLPAVRRGAAESAQSSSDNQAG